MSRFLGTDYLPRIRTKHPMLLAAAVGLVLMVVMYAIAIPSGWSSEAIGTAVMGIIAIGVFVIALAAPEEMRGTPRRSRKSRSQR